MQSSFICSSPFTRRRFQAWDKYFYFMEFEIGLEESIMVGTIPRFWCWGFLNMAYFPVI